MELDDLNERPRQEELQPAVTGEREQLVWPLWSVALAVFLTLSATLMFGSVALLVGHLAGVDGVLTETPSWVNALSTVGQQLAMVAMPLVTAMLVYKARPPRATDFGLRRTRLLSAVLWGGAVYVGFIVVSVLWTAIIGESSSNAEGLFDTLGVKDSTVLLVTGLALVTVGAPIVEEFLFRGYIFTALRSRAGVVVAALVSGSLFGLVHLGSSPASALVPLAALGVGLALLYYLTGSLLPCVLLHAANNSVAFSVAMEWTWQIPIVLALSVCSCLLLLLPISRRAKALPPASQRPTPFRPLSQPVDNVS